MPVFAEQKEANSALSESLSDNLVDRLKDNATSALASNSGVTNLDKVADLIQQQEPERKNLTNTMIFFDWDDTLLASTYLASNGYRLDTDMESKENFELVQAELKQLEACVTGVLSEALNRGKVHIVTNAEHGWVELSAQKFLPAVVPFLSKITVISARSTFEHLFPDAPFKWKFSAFREHLMELFSVEGIFLNVLSFGDSHVEREAIRTVTRGVENTRTKSVKFAESPSAEQLRKQLELITSHFHYIHTHEGDLDLMLKLAPPQSPEDPSSSSTAAAASSSSVSPSPSSLPPVPSTGGDESAPSATESA